MKLSVSLSEEDVAFLDDYARAHGGRSRSGVLQEALTLLRARELGAAYEAAWDEWDTTGEADAWEGVTGDGLAAG